MEHAAIAFGPFLLDIANEQLRRGTEILALRPKTFAVLRYLAEHREKLVSGEELLQAVWPETSVTRGVIKGCIRELRKALGDEVAKPRFIETTPRRGYRFIPPTSYVCGKQATEEPRVLPMTKETEIGKKALELELYRLREKLLK